MIFDSMKRDGKDVQGATYFYGRVFRVFDDTQKGLFKEILENSGNYLAKEMLFPILPGNTKHQVNYD